MSYIVQPYALDSRVLATSRGAKDARLAARAIKVARRRCEDLSEVSEAVREWIEGTRSTRDAST